jgi:hypothetical protein
MSTLSSCYAADHWAMLGNGHRTYLPRRFARTDSESVEPCRPNNQNSQSICLSCRRAVACQAHPWEFSVFRPFAPVTSSVALKDAQNVVDLLQLLVGGLQRVDPYPAGQRRTRPQFGNFNCVWYKPTTRTSTSWVGCTKIRLVIRQSPCSRAK